MAGGGRPTTGARDERSTDGGRDSGGARDAGDRRDRSAVSERVRAPAPACGWGGGVLSRTPWAADRIVGVDGADRSGVGGGDRAVRRGAGRAAAHVPEGAAEGRRGEGAP